MFTLKQECRLNPRNALGLDLAQILKSELPRALKNSFTEEMADEVAEVIIAIRELVGNLQLYFKTLMDAWTDSFYPKQTEIPLG